MFEILAYRNTKAAAAALAKKDKPQVVEVIHGGSALLLWPHDHPERPWEESIRYIGCWCPSNHEEVIEIQMYNQVMLKRWHRVASGHPASKKTDNCIDFNQESDDHKLWVWLVEKRCALQVSEMREQYKGIDEARMYVVINRLHRFGSVKIMGKVAARKSRYIATLTEPPYSLHELRNHCGMLARAKRRAAESGIHVE